MQRRPFERRPATNTPDWVKEGYRTLYNENDAQRHLKNYARSVDMGEQRGKEDELRELLRRHHGGGTGGGGSGSGGTGGGGSGSGGTGGGGSGSGGSGSGGTGGGGSGGTGSGNMTGGSRKRKQSRKNRRAGGSSMRKSMGNMRKDQMGGKMMRIGSRAQVMHGTARMTTGGLTKALLKYNKRGKIVSKKASSRAKKSRTLIKAGYRTKKGKFGSFKKK